MEIQRVASFKQAAAEMEFPFTFDANECTGSVGILSKNPTANFIAIIIRERLCKLRLPRQTASEAQGNAPCPLLQTELRGRIYITKQTRLI